MKLTEEQRKAIEHTEGDVCLSAGAGTGKTFVLVQRYLKLIETARADVHGIVAITFTEKAAREMKDRIRGACEERIARGLGEEDRTGVEKWQKVRNELESAHISTIHGFCARLLRENPVEAAVDPNFQVMDEVRTTIFLSKIVHRYLMRCVNDGEEGSLLLVQEYGWRRLERILCELLEKREECGAAFGVDRGRGKDEVVRRRKDTLEAVRRAAVAELLLEPAWHDAVGTLAKPGTSSSVDLLESRRRAVISLARRLSVTRGTDEAFGIVSEIGEHCKRVRARSADGGGTSREEMETALSSIGALVADYMPLVEKPDEAIEKREAELYAVLLGSYADLEKEYSKVKEERGVLDFEDLLIKVKELLERSPSLLKRLRTQFRYIMVDEFQDTNELQREIIYLLGGPGYGKLLVIGDEKQSIYRFRGADVSIFSKTRDDVVKTGGVELELSINFRSQPSAVHYFNDFFERAMDDFPGRRLYEPVYRPMQPSRPEHGGERVIGLLLVKGVEGELSPDLRRREAVAIASWIKSAVENEERKVYEPLGEDETPRRLRYGDVAVLFRAMTDVKLYERALQEKGIPYHLVAGSGFYGKQEIRDVVNFLRYLDNGEDEVALVGVLRSPFFGVSDETLFWLARGKRIGSFFRGSRAAWPRSVAPVEKSKLSFAREIFNKLARAKDRLALPELISTVLRETGYPAVLATGFMGPQKISNLLKLTDVARDLSRGGFFALSDFILYIDELVSSEIREGEAQVETEAGDVVRLMTVHKAKGLQFPVVIVPDIGRRLGHPRLPLVLWDRQWGVGLKVKNAGGSLTGGLLYEWLAREEKRKEAAEAKRIFYVVNTRARDSLLFSGSVGRGLQSQSWLRWMQRIYSQPLEKAEELPSRIFPFDGGSSVSVTVVSNGAESHVAASHRPRAKRTPDREGVIELRAGEIWERAAAITPPRTVRLGDVTVTQLEQYRECPRRFFFRYVQGIPEVPIRGKGGETPGLDAGTFGELVHMVLSEWEFERTAGQQWGRVGTAMRGFAILLDEGAREALLDEIKEMLRSFIKSNLYQEIRGASRSNAKRIFREQPFYLKIGPAVVQGKIDMLFPLDEAGWKLVDYKTERIRGGNVADAAERYRFQMGLYALAVRELLGFSLGEVTVVFLRHGRFHVIEPSREFFSWARREAEKTIRSISDGSFPVRTVSCPSCPYRVLCNRIKPSSGGGGGTSSAVRLA
jgi:ATP-dependent helicase/nuclease subunit A